MKKTDQLLFCLIILISALAPVFGSFFAFNSVNLDKSARSPKPALLTDGKLNLSYTLHFDNYFTDNFNFRTALISVYNHIFENVFSQSGNEKVIVGKEGFLFFGETLDDFLNVDQLSNEDILRLDETLRIQTDFLNQYSVDSYLLIVPNKASVYPEYMPFNLRKINPHGTLDRLRDMDISMPLIDVYAALTEEKSRQNEFLYHKRDSHWNYRGAAISYQMIMERLGKAGILNDLQQPVLRNDWQGDLDRMLYPAYSLGDQQFYYSLPDKFVFTRAIRSFDDLEIHSNNDEMQGRLIMFRDSFANALIPFLSESFAQVSYYRSFPLDYSKIRFGDSDTLILQIAQRNLNWYLQATPILPARGEEKLIDTANTLTLDFSVTQQKKSDMFFLNARFIDQNVAKKVTAVRIADQGLLYEAFPIYHDLDFEDDIIEYGFSLYTEKPINANAMEVYVLIEDAWFRLR